MLLVIGMSVGFWLIARDVRYSAPGDSLLLIVFAVLGGLSVIGPPILLFELWRRRVRWQAGKVLWFAQGMASWLLWPPVIYRRIQGKNLEQSMAAGCWMYGTPLMAIYVTLALLAGGWLRRGRRRRWRSWREQFGLLLGMAWACTGFYMLYLIYHEDT